MITKIYVGNVISFPLMFVVNCNENTAKILKPFKLQCNNKMSEKRTYNNTINSYLRIHFDKIK